MVTDSIGAIALLAHVVSEIYSIRREQLGPSLKPKFDTICSNDVPRSSKLLFGDDLAKQIRDAKEKRAASAKQVARKTSMTAQVAVGATTLIKVVAITDVAKVAQCRLFGERLPFNEAEKRTIFRRTRTRG